MKKTLHLLLMFIALVLYASPAYADIGVPMIFITLPYMAIALIPVILLETYVLSKTLPLPFKQSVKAAGIMNAVSTFIGIPLAWLILVLIQMLSGGGGAHGLATPLQKFLAITWQAPWLIPYESDLNWMIPAANAVLLIPFFFASWLVEFQVSKRLLKQSNMNSLKQSIFFANLVSYAILLLFTIAWLIAGVSKNHS